MLSKVTHCAGCVFQPQRWGDWEPGAAISCITYSQEAGLIHTASFFSSCSCPLKIIAMIKQLLGMDGILEVVLTMHGSTLKLP